MNPMYGEIRQRPIFFLLSCILYETAPRYNWYQTIWFQVLKGKGNLLIFQVISNMWVYRRFNRPTELVSELPI